MLNIYIDADACPVRSETIKVAERHDLDVYIVSNSWLKPINNPKIHMIKVESGADAADDWIAGRIIEDDIAITSDILLADRCLKSKANVLAPNGKEFTKNNIGSAIAGRSISAHLREIGETSSNNPSFSKQDRSRFLQSLEQMIQKLKRK